MLASIYPSPIGRGCDTIFVAPAPLREDGQMSEATMCGGSVLETLRSARGDSKCLLSRKSGLSRSAIRMYENGKRHLTPEASRAIAPVLELDPWSLYLEHNVEAIKQRIEIGEEKPSKALALARKLPEMFESGGLSEE